MDRELMGFELGRPVLVCRWRLQAGRLPCQGRHLRALAERSVQGASLTAPLVAWVSQHLEWTLAEGSVEHPDGTLMLVVDDKGRAAMSAGPYLPLADTGVSVLVARARTALAEGRDTGVAPEELLVTRGNVLVRDGSSKVASGVTSLVLDLARTTSCDVRSEEGLVERAAAGEIGADEGVLLASDEHGVVAATGHADTLVRRLEAGYVRLLELSRHRD